MIGLAEFTFEVIPARHVQTREWRQPERMTNAMPENTTSNRSISNFKNLALFDFSVITRFENRIIQINPVYFFNCWELCKKRRRNKLSQNELLIFFSSLSV